MSPTELCNQVYISVGSNIHPETHILRTAELLRQQVSLLAVSSLYLSAPVGPPDQPPFVNGVWRIATQLPPLELKYQVLRKIEARVGRIRTKNKYAPRPIDLDLIAYDDKIIETKEITLPDPHIFSLAHIVVPLLEVAQTPLFDEANNILSPREQRILRDTLILQTSLTDQLKGIVENG